MPESEKTARPTVGDRYRTVITGRDVVVRIISSHGRGGWWAENEATGRTVWIKPTTELRQAIDA